MTIQTAQLREITDYDSLMSFLAEELEWPMDFYEADIEDFAFEYTPEELGINPKYTAKIKDVRQLRPLDDSQPWGVFYLEFDAKKLPVVVLRRILRTLVRKKRASNNPADRRVWALQDLLFISAVGTTTRGMTFAYFHEQESGVAQLRTFRWDEQETQFASITPKLEALRWPDNPNDVNQWRTTWANAFPVTHGYSVNTAKELSRTMAKLAKCTKKQVLEVYGYESDETGPLRKLHESFKKALIQDLDKEGFADMLAQTLAYGLFSVRASGAPKIDLSSLNTLPKTNPFLQELLTELVNLAGVEQGQIDFDELGVSDLITMLNEADMFEVISSFGRTSQGEDPVVHFYEDFLRDYDKAQKVQRGVFYTPKPVVSFIVRSVHELLQTEFGLPDGLADTTTWGEMQAKHKDLKIPKDVSPDTPFVQILDPATGTGTFLETVIDVIYEHLADKWRKQGKSEAQVKQAWNDYVPEHLLPRLYGFELMMAPYAVAHLKLGLKLQQTGYAFHSDERLRIFLTNALEPARTSREQRTLDIPGFLSHEAAAADEVKQHVSVTVVVGNPPYSISSQNRGAWIQNLLTDYKKDLNERKLNLDDDFIKFVRLAQWQIQKATYGIMGLITSNTYLSGITHRRMRQSLHETFTAINVLDLHGSLAKKDTLSFREDRNVFEIKQGVAIGLFIKKHHEIRKVSRADLYGTREQKYRFLADSDFQGVAWNELSELDNRSCLGQFYFFVETLFKDITEYCHGISAKDIFVAGTSAVQTKRNALFVDFSRDELIHKFQEILYEGLTPVIRKKYPLEKSAGWSPEALASAVYSEKNIYRYQMTAFDQRYIYYDKELLGRARYRVMKEMLQENVALVTLRQTVDDSFRHVYVVNTVTDINLLINHHVSDQLYPLYVYPNGGLFDSSSKSLGSRHSNLKPSFIKQLTGRLDLKFTQDGKGNLQKTVGPEDVLHYIYAVLYSPTYRERYAEFLKIDFPRVPLTSSLDLFRGLCAKGHALVSLHLMERQGSILTSDPVSGDNVVEKPRYVEPKGDTPGRVYINKTQYFEGVPPEVWDFYIGGYRVCHKWLKDRKGRTLSDEDIAHYHKVVSALFETIGIMDEIDELIEEHGGWPLPGSVPETAEG